MANIFAGVLSALSKVANNGISTYCFWGVWEESKCPKSLID